MNIMQSFILYEENVPYSDLIKTSGKPNLNFYSYLLGYILLKEKYGKVSIVCNKPAYENFIKYIPYDNVINIETENIINYKLFWSKLKVDAYKELKAPLIHVDGDVLVFNDLLSAFDSGKYDVAYQNIEEVQTYRFYSSYNKILEKEITSNKLLSKNFMKSMPVNCGIVGFYNENIKNEYIDRVDNFYRYFLKNSKLLEKIDDRFPIYLEQYTLGDIINEKGLRPLEIFDYKTLKTYGLTHAGNVLGYSHLWGDSKYRVQVIDLVKKKIKSNYGNYYCYIDKFERERM